MKKTARRAGRAAQPPTKNKQLKIKKTKAYTYIFTKTPNQNVSVLALVLLLCGLGLHPLTARAVSLSLGQTNSFESGTDYVGWYGAYGGYTVLSKDCAHTGSRSLKYSGREESWYSPAINLYETFKENGAGRYRISMWVRTNAVYYYNPNIRMIIRGEGENSFITQEGPNYFYSLTAPISLSPGEWRYLTGTVDVEAGDIAAADGDFLLMLDYMEAVEDQLLYIDDFCIEKLNVRVHSVQFEQSTYYYSVNFDRDFENYVQAHVYPKVADNPEVRYYSSNTDIATVHTSTGRIITRKPGEVTITAYSVEDPNKKVTCKVIVQYQLYLYHYYDNGFSTRYPNDNVVYGINQNQAFVADIFDDLLDLRISGTVNYFASTADTCKGTVTSANLDSMCSHDPCCSDAMHMCSNFCAARHRSGNTVASILWSGHRTEWGGNNTNRSFAIIYTDGSRDMMMLANETTISQNRGTLLHETAHVIGAPDHYHETDPNTNKCKNEKYCSQCSITPRPYACTMESQYFHTTSAFNGKDYFCSGCTEDMRAHVKEHH